MSLVDSEREKYEKVFKFPGYGSVGHGLKLAGLVVDRALTRGLLGDFGCGRGGSFQTYLDAGFTVQPVDHVSALAPQWLQHPKVLPLATCNLWAGELPKVEYGLCTDVMEHIPEPHVSQVIENIARAVAFGCLWTVCHVQDVWGDRIGDRLHMTVRGKEWWDERFREHWPAVEVLRATPGNTIYWTQHGDLVKRS